MSNASDLTAVATFRSAAYLRRKILFPDSSRVSGYDVEVVRTRTGVLYSGVVKRETETELLLVERDGTVHTLPKAAIAKREISASSMMPGNYGELLRSRQVRDLVAYLLTLKGD